MSEQPVPAAVGSSAELGQLVEAAGMVNLLDHGGASCVYSEGCDGVTQEHLERFAALMREAERSHLRGLVRLQIAQTDISVYGTVAECKAALEALERVMCATA